jgi:hypothetical protein
MTLEGGGGGGGVFGGISRGISKVVSPVAKAFSNMIALAQKMIETKFCEIITTNFENL